MCKHVSAVLYGVGARLDLRPELLFVLRGVNHAELITEDAAKAVTAKSRKTARKTLAESELSEVFGIDVAPVLPAKKPAAAKKQAAATAVRTAPARPARSSAKPKPRPARSPRTPQREPMPLSAPKTAEARKTARRKPLAK